MGTDSMELTLDGLAYGGEAFGREAEGRMLFVPRALPGERVRVEIVEAHQHWARARVLEVLQASPDRVSPRCPHFGDCGGCHYQHMSYPAQLRAKAEIVRAQLERLGGFSDPPVEPTVPSPSAWGTRNHLQFSLAPDGRLGFLACGSQRVVPIRECHLPEPPLSELWPLIALEPIPGLERVAVRAGAPGERMVVLHAASEPEVELELETPGSVVWLTPRGQTVLAGSGALVTEVLGRPFRVSAGSFFQVNTALAGELAQRVLRLLAPQAGETVFDLYAGVGLFSAFLAQAGARVAAVEESPCACDDFEVNLEEFDTVDLYRASVEQALPAIPDGPEAVVVDPPRAGLGAEVLEALIQRAPRRLVYVSCDPATLARDGRRLAESGYRLTVVTPIDLFPQTYHIESLSLWLRQESAQGAQLG